MKICIVSSCGGHLTEVRQLKAVYEGYAHIYVLNDQVVLPDDMILFPGHNYAPLKHATMGEQKKTNPYLKLGSLKQFLAVMGPR